MSDTVLLLGAVAFILLVVLVVVFVPPLGGDPNRADGTDSGMGPD